MKHHMEYFLDRICYVLCLQEGVIEAPAASVPVPVAPPAAAAAAAADVNTDSAGSEQGQSPVPLNSQDGLQANGSVDEVTFWSPVWMLPPRSAAAAASRPSSSQLPPFVCADPEIAR